MYTVRNKSLDAIYKQYNTTQLDTLEAEQLVDICEQLKIAPKWNMNSRNEIVDLDFLTTLEIITANCEVSTYIGSAYWTPEIRAKVSRLKINEKFSKQLRGDETFELLASINLGLHKLKPGQTANLDAPLRWIKTELLEHPVREFLEIKDDQGVVVTQGYTPNATPAIVEPVQAQPEVVVQVQTPVVETTESAKGLSPEELDYPSLQKYVAELTGQKVVGLSKARLLELVQEHQTTNS